VLSFIRVEFGDAAMMIPREIFGARRKFKRLRHGI